MTIQNSCKDIKIKAGKKLPQCASKKRKETGQSWLNPCFQNFPFNPNLF